MFHDNHRAPGNQTGPETPPIADPLDHTDLGSDDGIRLRNAPAPQAGDDPLHFGEIEDALELVADGETGVLDGSRKSLEEGGSDVETEVEALRRELGTARAELSRIKQAGMDTAGWFGLSLLGGSPTRKLQGTEAAIDAKTRELKQLKGQIASAREAVRDLDAAKATVAQLEETRSTLQRQVEELQNAEASFADRARKLERLKDEETKLRESIDRLQAWVEKLQKDVDGYEAILPVETEKLATCRRDHETVSGELLAAQAERVDLFAELEALRKRRDDETIAAEGARVQFDELSTLCTLERENAETLAQEVAAWRDTLETLRADASAAEVNRDAYRDQGDRLCVALKEVEAKQAAEVGKLEELTAQVVSRNQELAGAERSASQAAAALESLQSQTAAERARLADLEAQTADQREALGELMEKLASAKSDREEVQGEVAALRHQISELDEMRAFGAKELESLDATLALRKNALAELERTIGELDEARQVAMEATGAEEARLAQVEADLNQREGELRLSTSQYEELERARETLSGEIEDATADRDGLTKQCAAREEEISAQRASLAEVMGNLVRVQTLADTRERELSKLEGRLKSSSAEHKGAMQRHQEELDAVLTKVGEANNALDALTERIALEESHGETLQAAREAELAGLEVVATDLREQIAQRQREQEELEAGVTQHREFLRGLEHQFRDLETSFQLRMEELQATRNKAEDELALKITALDEAAALMDKLSSAKRELAEVTADYERTLSLKERADERLRRSEERERDLYDRILTLEKRSASLRRIA